MNSKLTEAIAEDIGPDSPEVRADSVVSRPGRARAKVLQVRLTEDEYEALAQHAEERELPASTIARAMILRALAKPTEVNAKVSESVAAEMGSSVAAVAEAMRKIAPPTVSREALEAFSAMPSPALSAETIDKLRSVVRQFSQIDMSGTRELIARALDTNIRLSNWITEHADEPSDV